MDGHRLVEQAQAHEYTGDELVDALHKKPACFLVTGNPCTNEDFVQAWLAALKSKKEELKRSGTARALMDVSESEGEAAEDNEGLEKCVGCRRKISMAHWKQHKTSCRLYQVSFLSVLPYLGFIVLADLPSGTYPVPKTQT